MFGQQVLPYGSDLSGTFDEFKDPGHLVGKGWMTLRFDRIALPQGYIIPIQAKVVDVPQYVVDRQGRIQGEATQRVTSLRGQFQSSGPLTYSICPVVVPGRPFEPRRTSR
jgi:hypothetical protein